MLGALVAAVLVLAWAALSRTPWSEIGFVRPRSWPRSVAVAIVLGAAFKIGMKALVMPLLAAPPINPVYRFLTGNPAALPGMLFAVIVGAGFGEETLFRGYLFERLRRLLGDAVPARAAIVAVTSVLFALAHVHDQGVAGAEQALVTGLVFGAIFARTRRLPPIMIAHAAFDLMAVALIYWNLESRVAHLVFH